MPWPLSQDYNEAIQTPAQCFSDAELRQGEAVCNAMGLPIPCSGNFADVYAVQAGQQKWAVKCFTRQIQGLRERYAEISKYLQKVTLPFMVDFKFLEQGIRVRGQWYPILKMQWVEGQTLNGFVKSQLDNPAILRTVSSLWAKMGTVLREANLAHGDLQHGNVLLVPGSTAGKVGLKLVDYDGMCVPALELLKANEVGHPAYQHPQRLREGTFGLHIDRFSHLVIYTALRSLVVGGRGLWEKYDNGDNLLFSQKDFEKPQGSALFQELLKLNDSEVKKLVQAVASAAQKPLEQTPLLDDLLLSTATKTASSQSKATATSSVANQSKLKTGVSVAASTSSTAQGGGISSPLVNDRATDAARKKRLAIAGLALGATTLFAAALVVGSLALLGGPTKPLDTTPEVAVGKTQPVTNKEPEWVQLFNGKNLQGWKTNGADLNAWAVSDGILSGVRDVGLLYSERGDYRNFHFRIEAKITPISLGAQGFRAAFTSLPNGYYVQTDINRAPLGHKTGCLFITREKGGNTLLAPVAETVRPNEWYSQEIVAIGNRITVFVNERQVVDYIDKGNTFSSGHISLFTGNSPVQYRKVQIKELKGPSGS